MSATGQPSEEELRAAYEAEIKKIHVEQILLEQLVTLINMGMRRTGMQPGTEDERDPAQVRVAIEGVRALLPLVEEGAGAEQTSAIRQALSQLQLAYVRIGGQDPATATAGAGAGEPSGAAGGASGPGESAARAGDPGGAPAAADPGPVPPGRAGSASEPEGGAGQPGPAERSGRLWVPGQR